MATGAPEPGLLDPGELGERAVADAKLRAEREFPGELTIEVVDTHLGFDAQHLRHKFEQEMVIWRRARDFEFWLDELGRPVGFRDVAAVAASRWAEISTAEVVQLAAASGWLSPALTVAGPLRRVGDALATVAILDGHRAPGAGGFEVMVDPSQRRVVAIVPQPVMPSHDDQG
jgi:hypothetical protein